MTKYVNFLGFQLPVASEEEIAAKATAPGAPIIYGVPRVSDVDVTSGSPQLLARTVKVPCEVCEQLCWLDPVGFRATRGNAIVTCTRCISAHVKQDQKDV